MLDPVQSAPGTVIDMGELESHASPHTVINAHTQDDKVVVTWDDGLQATFHTIWLRDHCPCSACRHPQTRERIFKLVDHGPVPQPAVEASPAGALRVRWPEGSSDHVSLFDPGWLRQCAPGESSYAGDTRVFWDAATMDELPRVSWTDTMTSAEGLKRWLDALTRYGVALLTHGPCAGGEVLEAVGRIGWPRETNFGQIVEV